MPQPKYGARDGLAYRLEKWIERLGRDRALPWMGLGLIADMKTAVAVLNGEPEEEIEDWEKKMEFDL